MKESTQHLLSRIRSPRVQITYDVETGGARASKELPYIVGVMADLSGKSEQPLPPLKVRKFTEIDGDNFDDFMRAQAPRVTLSVPDLLKGDDNKLSAALNFNRMYDFSPVEVVKQIAPLALIYTERVNLNDLLGSLDGNDHLDAQLRLLLNDEALRKTIVDEIGEVAEGVTPPISETLKPMLFLGKMIRDEGHIPFAQSMIKSFISIVNAETTPVGNDIYGFVVSKVSKYDDQISKQMDLVLHHPDFQAMEAGWRGLNYFVTHTSTSSKLKIRVLNITKDELGKDLALASDFDQSLLFKKVYEEEYGTYGGDPYSCLVAAFEFSPSGPDVDLLSRLSSVAASAHAPLIGGADPAIFNMDSFTQMGLPRDLSKIFDSTVYAKWNSFREAEDARYINLVLPHMMLRMPYGAKTNPADGFSYEESVDGTSNDCFLWGNACYALATRITSAFSSFGWTAAIRGVEGGGMVSDLPAYTFKSADGDIVLKCPTEVAITDRREKELSDLGFISLVHCKGTDYSVFFGGQSTQKPQTYADLNANANAMTSTKLPYMLNTSRFAHYIKAMMRDKVGSFMSREEVSVFLNSWISSYVLLSDSAPQSMKARFPLREGRVDVLDVPGKVGTYKAVVFLRPHFQLEELTVSLRLVAMLPPPVTSLDQ